MQAAMVVKYGNPIAAHPAKVIARIAPSRMLEMLEPLSNDIFTPRDTYVAALSGDVRSLRVSAAAPSTPVVIARAEVFAKLVQCRHRVRSERPALLWVRFVAASRRRVEPKSPYHHV